MQLRGYRRYLSTGREEVACRVNEIVQANCGGISESQKTELIANLTSLQTRLSKHNKAATDCLEGAIKFLRNPLPGDSHSVVELQPSPTPEQKFPISIEHPYYRFLTRQGVHTKTTTGPDAHTVAELERYLFLTYASRFEREGLSVEEVGAKLQEISARIMISVTLLDVDDFAARAILHYRKEKWEGTLLGDYLVEHPMLPPNWDLSREEKTRIFDASRPWNDCLREVRTIVQAAETPGIDANRERLQKCIELAHALELKEAKKAMQGIDPSQVKVDYAALFQTHVIPEISKIFGVDSQFLPLTAFLDKNGLKDERGIKKFLATYYFDHLAWKVEQEAGEKALDLPPRKEKAYIENKKEAFRKQLCQFVKVNYPGLLDGSDSILRVSCLQAISLFYNDYHSSNPSASLWSKIF